MWTIEPPRPRHTLVAAVVALAIVVGGIMGVRVLSARSRPPSDLTANEAADLACFQGWGVRGFTAYVPEPREILVANLTDRAAASFFQSVGRNALLPDPGIGGFLHRTNVVVVRGAVTDGPRLDSQPRASGLVFVVDPDGTVIAVDVGPPWDTAVPPGAQPLTRRNAPSLSAVSEARARVELGGRPLVEANGLPGGLELRSLRVNPAGAPSDPTATLFPGRSVTLTYADPDGVAHLWLTESTDPEPPHVPARPLPSQTVGNGVTHYAFYAGSLEVDGFAWHANGLTLFLAAEISPDIPLADVTRTVVATAALPG
jgi:hypothetical protein